VSALGAERLSALLKAGQTVRVRLKLTCRTLPDSDSASVIGEIVGSVKPDEVVVMGGHLDSWISAGARTTMAPACVHALDALSSSRKLGGLLSAPCGSCSS